MKKIISTISFLAFVLTIATAQTAIKWNDSIVNFKGNKICQATILGKESKPVLLTEFYYGFDKTTKVHVIHLVKSNITESGTLVYLIYKYIIPANTINTADLKIETAENSGYETGGFLYVTLKCKDDKEDILYYEKSSSFFDFDSEEKTNEFSFEAGLNDKATLEKLIQQIKNNK
jgi:hypothetical protein